MANSNTNIVISAEDKTRQAFDSVTNRLGKLTGSVGNMSSLIGGLSATAAVGYFVTATKNFADYADEIGKAAQKVGTTTEKLSELKYAGDLADVTFEQLQTGLSKLAKNAEDFKDGSKSAIDAFGKLKIDPTTFKDSADIFTAVAEKLSKMEDGARKTAIAQELLGKSGKELIPLLNAGAAGFADAAKEAKAFGLVIDADAAAASERFNDNLTRLDKASSMLSRALGQQLIPSLADTAAEMAKAVTQGNLLYAVARGIAGIGKIPFDLVISDPKFTVTGKIKELRIELNQLQKDAKTGKNSGLIGKMLAGGSQEEINQKIKIVENQLATYEKYQAQLAKPPAAPKKTTETKEEALAFEELAKGINLTSVKLAELNKKQEEASKSFKAGAITSAQYNEITKAIQKQRDEINKTTPVKKQAADKDAEAAARFIESIQKKDAITGKSQSAILAYEAAHLKLSDSQKQVVNGIIEDIAAKEKMIEINKSLLDQANEIAQQDQAQVAEVQSRQQAYSDMAANLERRNEDLNISLITSDKDRAKAQLDIEYERSLEHINLLGYESEQTQDLIDKETEYYNVKKQEIDKGLTKTKSIGSELGLTFKSAFEDAAVGSGEFSDVIKGLEQDIIRLAMRRTILDPLLKAFDQLLGNFNIGEFIPGMTGSVEANAKGNVYSGPSISAYSGSVVSKPTFFARGGNVMGEAGPEAILPLKRGSDGKLGVSTDSSSSGMNVTVNLIESPGNGGQVNQKQDGNNMTLDIMVEKIESMMGRNISQGRGLAPTLERQYGFNRAAGSY